MYHVNVNVNLMEEHVTQIQGEAINVDASAKKHHM